jgi:hypothetical protein
VPEFSALWRPLIVGARPAEQAVIIVAYCAVVYTMLAAPVAVEMIALVRVRIASRL